ncbi:hypothetical protein OG612_06370 [Streptomyces sp. NBC_01527]|uniref:hypothetical protein n=1 Tax=Streptomyces sp. NBC_01527 TaxID=2903894 RepID=UPI003868CF0E
MAGMIGALGGALAGGVAAVRGARVGAETMAAAALQQIQDQAVTEHQQWLRGQRQQAYSALIAEVQAVRRVTQSLATALYVEHRREPQLEAVQASIRQLCDAGIAVALLGPEHVIEMQRNVTDSVLRVEQTLLQSFSSPPTDRGSIDVSLTEYELAAEDFVNAARMALGSTAQ